ncbi:MAG: CoA transferase [Alphaproteobacteria bacterium]
MSDNKKGALAGFRVVDLTRVLGGPYCTQILSDHGADVIKVEPPQGDETRDWGPPFDGDYSSYFAGVNRNKRGIALDLSKPEGRDVVLRLLDGADVLVENFKTGTLEKWGMGYEQTLKERFPRLIHCRVSGFGADGPLGGYPGYDAVVQAFSGLISVNGSAASGPVRMGTPVVDLGTGLISVNGILMAALERERSGLGQFLEVTLYDSAISMMHPHGANYFMSGKAPKIIGDSHPNIAPYDQFPTATCRIFLACGNDVQFRGLCNALGKPELAADERFKDNAGRVANRDALTALITPTLADRGGEELCKELLMSGLPAGPVLDVPSVMNHPHTRHREMVVEMGRYKGTGIPIKFARTPGSTKQPPPRFGEHSHAVLSEAGYSKAEIAALSACGALVSERRRRR